MELSTINFDFLTICIEIFSKKLYYIGEFVLFSTILNSYYTRDCTKWIRTKKGSPVIATCNILYLSNFQDAVRSNVGFSSLGKMDRHKKMRMQTKGNAPTVPGPRTVLLFTNYHKQPTWWIDLLTNFHSLNRRFWYWKDSSYIVFGGSDSLVFKRLVFCSIFKVMWSKLKNVWI